MLKPIFDKKSILVAWLDTDENNVFGTNMQWIGFIKNGYFFSKSCKYLGGYSKGTFVDKNGHPVAWLEGTLPVPTAVLPSTILIPIRPFTPITPIRPLQPLTPLRPLSPIGGWSKYSWNEFIH